MTAPVKVNASSVSERQPNQLKNQHINIPKKPLAPISSTSIKVPVVAPKDSPNKPVISSIATKPGNSATQSLSLNKPGPLKNIDAGANAASTFKPTSNKLLSQPGKLVPA